MLEWNKSLYYCQRDEKWTMHHLCWRFLLGELVMHDMHSFHQNDVAAAEFDNAHC
jgi:hypothetical protein